MIFKEFIQINIGMFIFILNKKEIILKKYHSNWLACINEIEATTTTKEKELLIKNMVIIIILLLNYYYNLFNLILFTYNFRNKK